jgi:dTDP-4-dehydrorhamnose reductase
MIKYLVTGSAGLVGSRFVDLEGKEKLLTPSIDELDILDVEKVRNYFEENKVKFEVVVNFAGYTNMDEAESQRGDREGLSWKLNVEGAENLAKVCHEFDKFLIHISTDFIFPGEESAPGPYSEDAKPPEKLSDTVTWYGWTKLEGERRVMEVNPGAAILRIAYPYYAAPYGEKMDFAKKIVNLYEEGKLYPLFEDQVFSTLYVDDLVEVIDKLAEKRLPGIFHAVNDGQASYWGFGSYLIEKQKGIKDAPEKGSVKEFLKTPGRTPRPIIGGLDTKKTQDRLGIKFRTWQEAADEFIENLS